MPKRLLLADDSLTIHRVVELTFADEDFEVISVSNGSQAVEKINSMTPDIIIADVNMPERDGYEVCAFVKNTPQFASIPVLLLKGTFEPFNQEKADAVRADGIIQKPFQSQTLIDKVNSILGLTSSHKPSTPGKTIDRIQAEKTTQPQPPFLPKTAQPSSPLKEFMPFSHPQSQPVPAPIPADMASSALAAKQAAPIPLRTPATPAVREGARPQPAPIPHAPKIPPFPFQPPAGGPDVMKPGIPHPQEPAQKPPQPIRPNIQQSPMIAEMDDSPFGITAVPPIAPKAPAQVDDDLSKDAFEAGKELFQTFSEPSEADSLAPQQIPQNIEAAEEQQWSIEEYSMDQKEQPAEEPIKKIQEKRPQNLPDFSDAMTDVSMAFENMQRIETKPKGYSPFEINAGAPEQQPFEVQNIEQNDSDMQIGSSEGEMVFSPESFEQAPSQDQQFTPFELEQPQEAESEQISIGSDAFEVQDDLNQLNISSLGEEELRMPKEKPEIPAVSFDADSEQIRTKAVQSQSSVKADRDNQEPVDVEILAEKVAARIMEKISAEAIKEIAWELVPGIVEKALRDKMNKS